MSRRLEQASLEQRTTSLVLPQPILRLPFPYKLYKLLDDADKGIHSDIVSWLPQGNGFQIHDSKAFCHTIMKTYFNQSKLKSFTRQLYLYGFLKVNGGPHEGAYFHPKFVRGDREGCLSIRRNQFQGDRRQSKQRTKNLNNASGSRTTGIMDQEGGGRKTNMNHDCSSRGVLLAGDSTTVGDLTMSRSFSMMQPLVPGAPPFDNSGEPFKAALTIFDQVFNLIVDDDGSCDTPRRNSMKPVSSSSSSSANQSQYCRRLPTLIDEKNQEHMTTPSHLPLKQLVVPPMGGRGYSWDDVSSYTMNHSISADCLPSKSNLRPPTTTKNMDKITTSATTDKNDEEEGWLEKLVGSLGDPLLLRVEDDATMESFDFSPRPIEEMFPSHDHCSSIFATTTPTPPPSSSTSMVLGATMLDQSPQEKGERRGNLSLGGVFTTEQRSLGLPV